MTLFRSALLASLLCAATSSFAQVYKCEGPDGVVEYSNSPASAQSGKKCRVMQLSPITTIPAPSQSGSSAGAAARTPSAASPAGFPKVDSATQKVRDQERLSILQEEMQKEEGRLEQLRKEYNNGEPERLGSERNYQKYLDRVQRLKDEIARAEANLVILRREMDAAGKSR